MNTTIPTPPTAGRWLFVPSGSAVPPSAESVDETASIGYSDFFMSELTSDSEDSETGARLSLEDKRARHAAKANRSTTSKWMPRAPTTPSTRTPATAIQSAAGPSPVQLIEALAVLHARAERLVTTHLATEDTDPALRQRQLDGVSAAIAGASHVLDAIDDSALSIAALSIAASRATARDKKTPWMRADQLVALSDRLRLAAEKMRDGSVETDGRRVDKVIRRVEREMKKGNM
ncbi:hypothetical protein BC830DRAFT_1135477 [Chytriomyces sp. MP71]|nr:hypothetical protein BC830DRAFT_1135477 [Chytriomyces sp. MP71]